MLSCCGASCQQVEERGRRRRPFAVDPSRAPPRASGSISLAVELIFPRLVGRSKPGTRSSSVEPPAPTRPYERDEFLMLKSQVLTTYPPRLRGPSPTPRRCLLPSSSMRSTRPFPTCVSRDSSDLATETASPLQGPRRRNQFCAACTFSFGPASGPVRTAALEPAAVRSGPLGSAQPTEAGDCGTLMNHPSSSRAPETGVLIDPASSCLLVLGQLVDTFARVCRPESPQHHQPSALVGQGREDLARCSSLEGGRRTLPLSAV